MENNIFIGCDLAEGKDTSVETIVIMKKHENGHIEVIFSSHRVMDSNPQEALNHQYMKDVEEMAARYKARPFPGRRSGRVSCEGSPAHIYRTIRRTMDQLPGFLLRDENYINNLKNSVSEQKFREEYLNVFPPEDEQIKQEPLGDAHKSLRIALKAATKCRNCGNPTNLRDEDAGSEREIQRLCVSCFHPKNQNHE